MTTTTARPRDRAADRPTTGRRIGWAVVLLTSLAAVAYAATPYLTSALASADPDRAPLAQDYSGQPTAVQVALYLHIAGGAVALLLSPFQLSARLRRRLPAVHRTVGRVALVGVAVGGAGAVVIAPFNTAGIGGLVGFGTLGVLWLWTAWRGYRAIRGGDVRAHQAWMVRCFALTYAGVTLRTWMPLLVVAQAVLAGDAFDADAAFENAYAAMPFLAWIPNLVVAELVLHRRGLPALRVVDPARA